MTVQDRPGRGDRPAIMRLGHYSNHALAGVIAVTVADDALRRPGVLTWLIAVIWLGFGLTTVADFAYHQHRLCERCIATSPLDPEAAVRRWEPALRAYHRKLTIAVLAVVIGWFFVSGSLRHWPWWAYGADAASVVLLGLSILAGYQHSRLYPWCPWCRWDEGGGEEVSPDVPVVPVAR